MKTTYNFRNPKHHIVDQSPEMLEFLLTNLSQSDARHLRNILMIHQERKVKQLLENENESNNWEFIDLFAPNPSHLSLVSQ